MNMIVRLAVVAVVCIYTMTSAFAIPEHLEAFKKDPYRRAELDGCTVCHNGPNGGSRNAFGQQLEGVAPNFPTMVRAANPDKFAYPTFKLGETMTLHFADPTNKQLVIETNGKKYLVDMDKRSVNGIAAQTPSAQ